jgi:rhodanese-related sulfurtransferase
LINTHRALALGAVTLGGVAGLVGGHSSVSTAQLALEIDHQQDHISAVDVGESLMRGDPTIRIFDLRSQDEFEALHIPGALRSNLASLGSMKLSDDQTVILYSAGGAHAAQAWMLLRMRGHGKVYFLREGLYEWTSLVSDPRLAVDATPAERSAYEHAKALSRFFGGEAKEGLLRSELPRGYWTGSPNDGMDQSVIASQTTRAVRRRGC